MKIGMVGLGKMGANMTHRLLNGGHEVVAFDLSEPARAEAAGFGAATAATLAEMTAKLDAPRVAWVMVPAGAPTDQTIETLASLMQPGDVIVDGGNSFYKDGIAAAARLEPKGIRFIDAGVSGGIWGLENGYCLMVGGDRDAVAIVEPAFLTLAPEGGYAHVGPVGAGHYVKMVHNGIEYGMVQAYGEGFELMHAADSGEGRWTVNDAVERAVPAPAISASLFARFASRQDESFAARLAAALRNQFGGHAIVSEHRE